MSTTTWREIAAILTDEPEATVVLVRKRAVEHPRDGGMDRRPFVPAGQRASFWMAVDDARTMVVCDRGPHYEARLLPPDTGTSRAAPPVAAAVAGDPLVAGGFALGALAGMAVGGGNRDAVLIGAFLGGIVGVVAGANRR